MFRGKDQRAVPFESKYCFLKLTIVRRSLVLLDV